MDVVIGTPLIAPNELGFENCFYTDKRYLPYILVDTGFFKSVSQVKKNRPDLCITLDTLNMQCFKIGKRHLWVLTGKNEETDDDQQK